MKELPALERKHEESRSLKSRLRLRKGRTRSPHAEKNSRKKPISRFSYTGEKTDSTPLEEKQKDERRKLNKLNHERNREKYHGNPTPSVDSEIHDIEKRYWALLPAIKAAIMEHANFNESSLITHKGPGEYRQVQDAKQSVALVDNGRAYSSNSLMTAFSVEALEKRGINPNDFCKKTNHASEDLYRNCAPAVNYSQSQPFRGKQQSKTKISKNQLSIASQKADGYGDNGNLRVDSIAAQSKKIESSRKFSTIKETTQGRLDPRKIIAEETSNKKRPVDYTNHPNQKVEQNRLCAGPNTTVIASYNSIFSSISETSAVKQGSNAKSNLDQPKCKCKDIDREPCICKSDCDCEEQVDGSSIANSIVTVPSTSIEELLNTNKSKQVQTSFSSSNGPCNPDNCPNRKRRIVEKREVEVQIEDDIEWEYEKTVRPKTFSTWEIPPKRTATMDDRLLRRVTFFDTRQNSVCNKNVAFCIYKIASPTKKMISKGSAKGTCPDCPGSNKCNLALKNDAYHLTCNEIAVEVKALELNQSGVDSLRKVCSFVYIDYVFLGHVGNETSLAPVSNCVLFDSRKSYSVSLKFNRKERSILREQVNPAGFLVKDSIMFIVVCQAAPELGIHKNWDFGFGRLSMKQIAERTGSDKISLEVQMNKIGGTNKNIGKLIVIIEGLKLIKSITSEKLSCVEPQVDAVIKKLNLNHKEMEAADYSESRQKSNKTIRTE